MRKLTLLSVLVVSACSTEGPASPDLDISASVLVAPDRPVISAPVNDPAYGARFSVIPIGGELSKITDPSDIVPATTLTFGEAGVTAGTLVTTQYAAYGVTFSAGGFTQSPQTGSFPGVNDNTNLGNFGGGVACAGPRSIYFTTPVAAAGFNIVTNGPDQLLLEAKRGGASLGSTTFNTSTSYATFAGLAATGGIDELVMTIIPDDGSGGSNRCMLMDNLAFGGDYTPPEIALSVDVAIVWPPNHKMREVATVSATDDQDASPDVVITVESNEPIDGSGDGSTDPDWAVVDNGDGTYTVSVRAERAGDGDGRIYTISVVATDDAGNEATASATVTVPHSQKK